DRHETRDTTSGIGASFPELSGGTVPAGLSNDELHTAVERFSEELRVVSPHGHRIEWLLGGFYLRDSLTDQAGSFAFHSSYQPIAYFAPAISYQVVPTTYTQKSIFGDLTWHVTERTDLIGGIRHDHDDQTLSALVFGATIPEPETLSDQYSEDVT